MPQAPPHSVADHRRTDLLTHHEANPGRLGDTRPYQQMRRQQRPAGPAATASGRSELRASPHPRGRGKHGRTAPGASSDADPGTALPAPRRDDCPAGPGAHPKTETVGLGPVAVVRLKRALAHWNSRSGSSLGRTAPSGQVCHDDTALSQQSVSQQSVTGDLIATRSDLRVAVTRALAAAAQLADGCWADPAADGAKPSRLAGIARVRPRQSHAGVTGRITRYAPLRRRVKPGAGHAAAAGANLGDHRHLQRGPHIAALGCG